MKSKSPGQMQVLAICRRLAITGVLIFVSTATGAIIPSSNQIDWTQSGIPGGVAGASGIPNRTAIYATIDASAYGNDQTDATAAIQSALNNCPANEVVYIPAGTYLIKGSISIPSNVTLRGAGPTLTILDAQGTGSAVVTFGPGATPVPSSSVAITGGATQGSISITVSSTSGISVGSLLLISELNDPTLVTINGTEGICTWCDGGLWNGTRAAGQTVQVTSLSGTTAGKPEVHGPDDSPRYVDAYDHRWLPQFVPSTLILFY